GNKQRKEGPGTAAAPLIQGVCAEEGKWDAKGASSCSSCQFRGIQQVLQFGAAFDERLGDNALIEKVITSQLAAEDGLALPLTTAKAAAEIDVNQSSWGVVAGGPRQRKFTSFRIH